MGHPTTLFLIAFRAECKAQIELNPSGPAEVGAPVLHHKRILAPNCKGSHLHNQHAVCCFGSGIAMGFEVADNQNVTGPSNGGGMYSDPASRIPRRHANGWMTMLALGLLVLGLLACLYILVGVPAEAQVSGSTIDANAPATSDSAAPVRPLRRLAPQVPAPTSGISGPTQAPVVPAHTEAVSAEFEVEVRDQLQQSQRMLHQAAQAQRQTRMASALFLVVFAIIAAVIVVQVYVQARGWDRETERAFTDAESLATQIDGLRTSRGEARNTLPGLLQEVGEQPLSFQEEGSAFSPGP